MRNVASSENQMFLKFEDWRQIRPFTLSLRKVYKEKIKLIFESRQYTEPGFVSVYIPDIAKAVAVDLYHSVAWFGSSIPLLQLNGAPQGSPLSGFCASVAAAYIEDRHWPSLFSRVRQITNSDYLRVLRMKTIWNGSWNQ